MFMRVTPFSVFFAIIPRSPEIEKGKLLDKKMSWTENSLNKAGRTEKDKRTDEEAGSKGEMT